MKTSALHQLYDSLGQLIEQIQLVDTDASDSDNEIDIYPQQFPIKQLVAKSISGNVTGKKQKEKRPVAPKRSMR